MKRTSGIIAVSMTADARAVYQELLDNRARRYVDYGSLAIAAQAAGDLDAYFEYAHQSCDERERRCSSRSGF